ncbi:KdsC family phosphatase [Salinibacter ruber]|uniref:3-deoxy-D-manno-octulosonate 8-phosphate phosphatase KdsC n=1 Tax=Salinibacter ruber TaxID=146919 RepID=A0A9X2UAY9_9BACT|nr:hypothetical protein [Salinibacter ruber]MCS3953310.1 YrbI family 3-deoxy-D-manno-octulosonate 8-phosphate phosphatase [Salinibacter ruber]
MAEIKVIISDVDGVLTDGGMIYHSDGTESKKFSVYDGGGTALAEKAGLDIVAMSGEEAPLIGERCRKMGIEDVRLGVKNKLKESYNIKSKYGIENKEVIVISDFINDLNIMREFKSACPKSAPELIRSEADWVVGVKGGEGVLWHVVKEVLLWQEKFNDALGRYLKSRAE